jgi:asparagine synthase (glutamine-hydrolysing)
MTPARLPRRDEMSACAWADELPDGCSFVPVPNATPCSNGLVVLEDNLSMIHSLETGTSLRDHPLGLPWSLLSDGKAGKIRFREAVRPWVPREVHEKPKMGYGPPGASWYRGRSRLERQLSGNRTDGVLRAPYMRRKLDEHFAGRANHVLIWCPLSFTSWCRLNGTFGATRSEREPAVGVLEPSRC